MSARASSFQNASPPIERRYTYDDMIRWCEQQGDMRLIDQFQPVKEGGDTYFKHIPRGKP